MKTLGQQFKDAMASEHFAEAIRNGATVLASPDCFEEVRRLLAGRAEVRLCELAEPGTIYTVDVKAMERNMFKAMGIWLPKK